ncbi:MAG: FHA domain-containing protein [Micrococcaceae bacterium]|nr:FHA domain-containing protein [Micrococcaceae bacterium]
MSGENRWEDTAADRKESAAETTSIGLPPTTDEVSPETSLSTAARAAGNAVPARCARRIGPTGPNRGARFLLDGELSTVGRHPEADIFLDDVTVSRKHAQFRRDGEGFQVVDSGSLNGTYVNGDRVDAVRLRTGSEVRIGKFRLTFYSGTVPTTAARQD